jgi:hypothetical protein
MEGVEKSFTGRMIACIHQEIAAQAGLYLGGRGPGCLITLSSSGVGIGTGRGSGRGCGRGVGSFGSLAACHGILASAV